MAQKVELRFGVMAPPLRAQLKEQGLTCTRIAEYEADRQATQRLRIGGFLSDGEAMKASQRLMAVISRNVHPAAPTPSPDTTGAKHGA